MTLNKIHFIARSTIDFQDRDLAAKTLGHILAQFPFRGSIRFGKYEPDKKRYTTDRFRDLENLWMGETYTSPVDGEVFPDGLLFLDSDNDDGVMVHWRKAKRPSFSTILGSICSHDWPPPNLPELASFVVGLVPLIEPVYCEIRDVSVKRLRKTHDLTVRLPDIPWFSIFGIPYINMFGRDKLASAPFYSIESIGPNHMMAKATREFVQEVPGETRRSIREHLGSNAFQAYPQFRYKTGLAPLFDFSGTRA